MVFVNLRHDFSNILFENFYNKLILPTFKTIPNECPPESEFLEGLLPPLKTSASPSSPSSVICHVILVFPNIETLPANKGERLTVLESAENEIAACVAIKYFPSSNCALMKNLVIKQEFKGQKYAEKLVAEGQRAAVDEAKRLGKNDLDGYFIETANEAADANDTYDPIVRQGLWRRMGFFALNLRYSQPIIPGKRASTQNMTLMIYRDYMHLATEIDRTVASASAVDKKRVLGNDNVLTESTEDLLGKMSSSTTSSSKSAHTLSTPVTNSKQDSVGSLTSNMDRLAVSENNSSSSSKRRSINAEVQSKVVSREVLTEFLGELYASILGGDKYGTDSNFVKMMRQLEMLPTNAVAIQSEIKQAW